VGTGGALNLLGRVAVVSAVVICGGSATNFGGEVYVMGVYTSLEATSSGSKVATSSGEGNRTSSAPRSLRTANATDGKMSGDARIETGNSRIETGNIILGNSGSLDLITVSSMNGIAGAISLYVGSGNNGYRGYIFLSACSLHINLDEAYGSLITLSEGNSTISSSIYPGVSIFIKDGSSSNNISFYK
jgi:hypothetical protein